MTPPTDKSVERLAILMAMAKEGKPDWPEHLSNVERDVYLVKAMELIGLLLKASKL